MIQFVYDLDELEYKTKTVWADLKMIKDIQKRQKNKK